MNNFRKIKKNAKALSPVVASIILIAVTVAVSVVVAAWMGGMTTGLMGSAEQVQMTNIGFSIAGTNDAIIATIQNTGSNNIQIKSAFVNGLEVTLTEAQLAVSMAKGESHTFSLDMGSATYLTDGTLYQVKLVTAKGTVVVNTATYTA
jgi:archaeal type IV pilus assembly protein PilA